LASGSLHFAKPLIFAEYSITYLFNFFMKRFTLIFVLLGSAVISLTAQNRYGHLNFGELLSVIPDTKGAEASLEAYQKQLMTEGQAMVARFETSYTDFARLAQGGELTPLQQQQKQQELEKQQQEILDYEQKLESMISQRRNELLEPIVTKARAAIDQVAKANQYVMVFDTSTFNAILFAVETENILPLVKKQLGLPE
jgi:outer membrane protein